MQSIQGGDVFYGVYHSGGMSLDLSSTTPFHKALNRVAHIYIVPRETLKRFNYGKKGCGLIVGPRTYATEGNKYVIYVAEDLSHSERLITVAHELIHLVLVMQGVSFERQMMDAKNESWVEELAQGFYLRNPDWLNWAYVHSVRIAA